MLSQQAFIIKVAVKSKSFIAEHYVANKGQDEWLHQIFINQETMLSGSRSVIDFYVSILQHKLVEIILSKKWEKRRLLSNLTCTCPSLYYYFNNVLTSSKRKSFPFASHSLNRNIPTRNYSQDAGAEKATGKINEHTKYLCVSTHFMYQMVIR